MRTVLVVLAGVILICMSSMVVAGGIPNLTGQNADQAVVSKIPNMTVIDEDTNGRPQHLDTDNRSGEDLTPVEQKIIQRDTIQSNRDARPEGANGN